MRLLNPEHSRNPAHALYIAQMGGEIVLTDDPEYAAYTQMFDGQSPLDSQTLYRELILVRIPEEKLLEKREREEAITQKRIRSGGEAYVQQASTAELQASQGQATRFRRRDHSTQLRAGHDDAAPVLENWTPDAGIVRVEDR